MPLLPSFKHAVFDTAVTQLMGEAFDMALEVLAQSPRLVVQECMANRIIEAASHGKRDVKRLRDAAFGAPGVASD
jgi:hypothetical protein